MLKGINEINNILNDFLEEFDCTADVAEDFEYLYAESLIHYSFVISEKGEKEFIESVNRHNPIVNCDTFLWSLLHELGHHETIDDLSDNEYADSQIMKDFVEFGIVPTDIYYYCPDEVAATAWAVQYANSHIDLLQDLWNRLQPAIMNFYKINNVEY